MKALKRNTKLQVTYFPEEESFDVSKLKGRFDVILLPENHKFSVPDKLENIKNIDIPVIARCGDFHNAEKYNTFEYHDKYNIDYYFNFMSEKYFYKFYPKSYNYREIIFGVEPILYQNLMPFSDRIKEKILNSGAIGKKSIISRIINRIVNPKRSGWYFYKLRTMCDDLSYVEHIGMVGKKYVNDDYPKLLSRYRAAIVATTFYPTIKYLESSAAGCLTFMEITDTNNGKYLGYIDNETSIFINEKNYKKKFNEYLENPDDPKWEQIAKKGHEYTMKNFTNDVAVEHLIELMNQVTGRK